MLLHFWEGLLKISPKNSNGIWTEFTWPYKGMIDDVKIFGIALDDASVEQVYHENGW